MKSVGLLVLSVSVSTFAALAGCNTTDAADDGAQSGDVVAMGNPNGKGAGGECTVGNDCKSGKCESAKCTAPETDVGHGCAGPADCESKVCTSAMCQPAKIDDGVKNGDETDVDCGGAGADTPR